MLDTVKNRVNGLDLAALGEVVEAIGEDPKQALVGFDVTTRWTYIGSGMVHERFKATLENLSPNAAKRIADAAPIFA